MAGEVAERTVDRGDRVTIDLDCRHGLLPEDERREDISSASGTDHQNIRVRSQMVGEVDEIVPQIVHVLEVAVVIREHGRGRRVDVKLVLRPARIGRQLVLRAQAGHLRRVARLLIVVNPDARERVPFLVQRGIFPSYP